MNMMTVAGAKGGESQRRPVEAPDSLISVAYAKYLDLISEGPIESLDQTGVYFDGTPMVSDGGVPNFQNVEVEFRVGTPTQDPILSWSETENEIIQKLEMRSETQIVRTVTGENLSALRFRISTPSFFKQNMENGDTEGYRVSFAIDLRTLPGGVFSTVANAAFDGKTTSQYERSIRVDLPASSEGWEFRIRRLTPNANSTTVQDLMYLEGWTEIVDAKLRYPNCALVGSKFDATMFQGVPTRAFWGRWRIIQIPANYDPYTRTYATTGPGTTNGVWNGQFKAGWTNNPAWIFYDIMTNRRFGLGNRIRAENVDRYYLYNIARYCDQLVSDGKGGQEPRFTCNIQFQERAGAAQVLRDMASVFRGVCFYGAGQIVAVADMPGDPGPVFTNASVQNGEFKYSGSSLTARHTVALVSWSDPKDFGRAKVEPSTHKNIARYGVNATEVTAFGCTSQGQAQRVGAHILESENRETRMVSFAVGLEGLNVIPGENFRIADQHRAGRRVGGRVRKLQGVTVTLDAEVDGMAPGDMLYIVMPSGKAEGRTVTAVAGPVVTVGLQYSATPVPNAVWATSSPTLGLQEFRVVSITENEGDDQLWYEITALQRDPTKYQFIDDGTLIDLPPTVIVPPSIQPPPTNVLLASHSVIDQGIATHVLDISWTPADKAVAYEVEWRRDNLPWVKIGRVPTASVEVRGVYAGQYLARVHAVGALDSLSIPAVSMLTQINGKTTPPPSLTHLTTVSMVMGIALEWGFPVGATDTERTEIWENSVDDLNTAYKLGDFAYPQTMAQKMGLAAGVRFFYWGRLVDKSGNIGPWYPVTNGVMGESSTDPSAIMDYIKGQIDLTDLGQDLQEQLAALVPEMAGTIEAFAGDDTKYAGVWSQLYAQQAGDTALAGEIRTVVTRVDETNALVQVETQARIDGDSANASQITTVQAVANNAEVIAQQSITAVNNVDGKIGAFYNIKLGVLQDGRYYAAGMGIGVENTPGGMQTQILFQADRMALLSMANGVTYTPFLIENGQVFMNDAFIRNASITSAKIGDLESSALGAGNQPRWRLSKNGGATFTGPVGNGYLAINDQNIFVRDPNGNPLVAFGDNI